MDADKHSGQYTLAKRKDGHLRMFLILNADIGCALEFSISVDVNWVVP